MEPLTPQEILKILGFYPRMPLKAIQLATAAIVLPEDLEAVRAAMAALEETIGRLEEALGSTDHAMIRADVIEWEAGRKTYGLEKLLNRRLIALAALLNLWAYLPVETSPNQGGSVDIIVDIM